MRRSVLTDVILGAAAGAGATWLMDLATTALLERQPRKATLREERARGERSAVENAAEKIGDVFGADLTRDERKKLGTAIHWSLGVFAGATYAGLRHSLPSLRYGSGLAYGVAFWLLMDEGANALLGFSAPPQEFPWQTHARGLAGHLVLGGAIEAVFDAADLLTSTR
jgi:uncharacterized protein DUF1440